MALATSPSTRKDVVELAIVTLGPDMLVGGGTDQLHIDVHGVGDFLHAAFEDVGDAELLPISRRLSGALLYF